MKRVLDLGLGDVPLHVPTTFGSSSQLLMETQATLLCFCFVHKVSYGGPFQSLPVQISLKQMQHS